MVSSSYIMNSVVELSNADSEDSARNGACQEKRQK